MAKQDLGLVEFVSPTQVAKALSVNPSTVYGSASKYADRFTFDTAQMEEPTIENYVKTIQEAGRGGYRARESNTNSIFCLN